MPGFSSTSSVGNNTNCVFAFNGDFSGSAQASDANGLQTNGQLWIGSTAVNAGNTHINVGTIVSTDSGITIGYSSPNITLTVAGGTTIGKTITGDIGGAISPVAGNWNILGAVAAAATTPIQTSGSGNTLSIQVQRTQTSVATDATRIGLAAFKLADFSVDGNGFVSLSTTGAGKTITGNSGGALSPTANNWNILGASAAAGTSPVTTSGAVSTLTVNVQTSQALAAADATKIGLSNFDSSSFAVAATGFVTLSTTGAGKTITGDSGGALSPTANNWNILGGPGVTTSGSGSTLTINSVVFTDTTAATLAVDNGYNATAAGTYNMPATAAQGEMIIVFCDTTGAVVLDCPALNFIRVGELITSSGGTMTSTKQGDSLTLRYRLSSLTWEAISVVGTWLAA